MFLDPERADRSTPAQRKKATRRREADRIAQSRGTLPDARTYFHQVQLVKAEHLRRNEAIARRLIAKALHPAAPQE